MNGRRENDKPKLKTAETITRLNEVAQHFNADPVSLMWGIAYVNGELNKFTPKGMLPTEDEHTCTYSGCNRKAFLKAKDGDWKIYRCGTHAWRADESTDSALAGYMIQFPNSAKAEFVPDDRIRFFS
jgi:hypothetical protein